MITSAEGKLAKCLTTSDNLSSDIEIAVGPAAARIVRHDLVASGTAVGTAVHARATLIAPKSW